MLKRILAFTLALMLMLPLVVACNSDTKEPLPTAEPTEKPTETQKPTEPPVTDDNKDEDKDDENTENKDDEENQTPATPSVPSVPDKPSDVTPSVPTPPVTDDDDDDDDDDTDDEQQTPSINPDDFIVDVTPTAKALINNVDAAKYTVVYGANDSSSAKAYAEFLAEWLSEVTEKTVPVVSDTTAPTKYEILVGQTNRPQSNVAINGLSSEDYSVNAIINSNKVAICAKSAGGYNIAKRTFVNIMKNNDYKFNDGFKNGPLSYAKVQALMFGKLYTAVTNNGIQVRRSTDKQVSVWPITSGSNSNCPKYNVGANLAFETNSSYFTFTASGNVEAILINGVQVAQKVSKGYYELDTNNATNKVKIVFGGDQFQNWTFKSLEVEAGATITPYKHDLNILLLGDSVTEGYNHGKCVAGCTSINRTHQYSWQMTLALNANTLNQGYSGNRMEWTQMLDPDIANYFTPDMIVIALGINDWLGNKAQNATFWTNRVNAYMDKLQEIYPNVPVVAVTPIRILMQETLTADQKTTQLANQDMMYVAMENAFKARGASVVHASTMLTQDGAYYNEDLSGNYGYHPNHEGHKEYGQNLAAAIKQLDCYKAIVNN